jgi:polysulfide reductase chain C
MREVTWGIPVVIYLFLAGLGAGSFCLGTITSRKNGEGWDSCSRMAFLLAPVAIVCGLLMLILDLRYKTRFWRTLVVLNPRSPMSIGVWLLSIFFIISLLAAICWLPISVKRQIPGIGDWIHRKGRKWSRALGFIGIPFALGVSVYTGVLLSVTIVPLWRNPGLPILFFLSALSLGIESGAILGAASLRSKSPEAMLEPLRFLKKSYRLILPLYFLASLLFVFSLTLASDSRVLISHFFTGWSGFLWWVGVIGVGIVLPMLIVMRTDRHPMRHAWLFSGSLLLGDFLLRFVLILAGQGVI